MAVKTMTRKITDCEAYKFCEKSIKLDSTPRYVKLQMADFMSVCEGKNEKYMISGKKLKQLENILKLLVMPKGLKAGQPLYNCTVGYQWLFYTAILCEVYRDDPSKRRYETGVLEIARKNFKSYTTATIFILLFLTEPPFSRFFSVAPDRELSMEVRRAMTETIKSSPKVYENNGTPRFKIQRSGFIEFTPLESEFTPLAFSVNRMDGRMPTCWVADEVSALRTNYPLEAMQKGQIGVKNKLGLIISTKYTTVDNPFEDEVGYSKRVLDGLEPQEESRFALLYEPDETKGWETNDIILKQANPVALEIPEIWDDLVQQRALAVAIDNKRAEFVTKNCNIIYQGAETETYIDVKDVQACRVANIDWKGRVVYLGLDLSMSGDNTSVSMLALDDDNNILAKSWAFIPEALIDEKSVKEKVNYRELIKKGDVIACGDRVIDYGYIEDFIMSIEEKYGVQIQAIGTDPWNALSTSQRLENVGYSVVLVKQHSSVLSAPQKLLKEMILSKKFQYEKNIIYEINFQNARCTYDANMNAYVHKKKSSGKVDMVMSTANAVYLLQQDALLDQAGGFTVQVV